MAAQKRGRGRAAGKTAPVKEAQSNQTRVSELLGKSEVWVGLVVIVVAALVIGNTVRNTLQRQNSTPTPIAEVTPSPALEDQQGEQEVQTQPAQPKVAFLANTTGEYKVVVKGDDSLWKISERVCGTGEYYLAIQERNGYTNRSLQPGDIILVECVK